MHKSGYNLKCHWHKLDVIDRDLNMRRANWNKSEGSIYSDDMTAFYDIDYLVLTLWILAFTLSSPLREKCAYSELF